MGKVERGGGDLSSPTIKHDNLQGSGRLPSLDTSTTLHVVQALSCPLYRAKFV